MYDLPPGDQKALLKRIAAGDVAAFKTLFDACQKKLYAAAMKMTKSAYGAEEIVQETFADLWDHRSSLAQVENAPAYLYSIAYHTTIRYLKKVAADDKLLHALKTRTVEMHNEPEETLLVNETRGLIDHAIRDLPSQRKLIFKLSREDGLSHKEIADRLHISPLTVKKQLVLAIRNIRSSLTRIAPVLSVFLWHIRR